MNFDWVIGSFEGKQAESVLAHTHTGIGYFILEQSGNRFSKACIAAFKRPCDSPVPEHLMKVTDPANIAKYDALYAARSGIDNRNG